MGELMAETFMINQLKIKPKNIMKSERLQQDKEMIIQQDVVRLSTFQRSLSINCSRS